MLLNARAVACMSRMAGAGVLKTVGPCNFHGLNGEVNVWRSRIRQERGITACCYR